MTKISNFRINTHFTALKQLPDPYRISLSFAGGSYGFTLGRVLAQGTVSVKAGAYVENATIKTSYDGDIVHSAHIITISVGGNINQRLVFTLNQVSSAQYSFRVSFTNTTQDTVSLPAFNAEAVLRLATAPFNY